MQDSVQEAGLCKREKKPGHGVISWLLQQYNMPLRISPHSRTDAEKTWPPSVMGLSSSHYDEKSIFCNIASLQIFLWEVEMSQLVRRQVKPLISSDQVNSGRRDCLQFCVRMSVHVYRERPGWGCSPCTRPGGDTFPSCARTSTCPELRLSATQLSG